MADERRQVDWKWPWPNLCEVCGGHVERMELWQEPTDGGLIYGHQECVQSDGSETP